MLQACDTTSSSSSLMHTAAIQTTLKNSWATLPLLQVNKY